MNNCKRACGTLDPCRSRATQRLSVQTLGTNFVQHKNLWEASTMLGQKAFRLTSQEKPEKTFLAYCSAFLFPCHENSGLRDLRFPQKPSYGRSIRATVVFLEGPSLLPGYVSCLALEVSAFRWLFFSSSSRSCSCSCSLVCFVFSRRRMGPLQALFGSSTVPFCTISMIPSRASCLATCLVSSIRSLHDPGKSFLGISDGQHVFPGLLFRKICTMAPRMRSTSSAVTAISLSRLDVVSPRLLLSSQRYRTLSKAFDTSTPRGVEASGSIAHPFGSFLPIEPGWCSQSNPDSFGFDERPGIWTSHPRAAIRRAALRRRRHGGRAQGACRGSARVARAEEEEEDVQK